MWGVSRRIDWLDPRPFDHSWNLLALLCSYHSDNPRLSDSRTGVKLWARVLQIC